MRNLEIYSHDLPWLKGIEWKDKPLFGSEAEHNLTYKVCMDSFTFMCVKYYKHGEV